MMIATGLGFRQHFVIARDPQFSLARIDFGSGPGRTFGPRFCFLRKESFLTNNTPKSLRKFP
jgi:hypothetical protein